MPRFAMPYAIVLIISFFLIVQNAQALEIFGLPDDRAVAVDQTLVLEVETPLPDADYTWLVDGQEPQAGVEIDVMFTENIVHVIRLQETVDGITRTVNDFANVLPVTPEPKTHLEAWIVLTDRFVSTAEDTVETLSNPFEQFPVRNLALEEGLFSPNWFYQSFWTGGFWVGGLWRLYDRSGDDDDLKRALDWSQGILGDETRDDHDRGFVYFYSSAFAYDRTDEQIYLDSVETALAKMVELFEESNSGTIPIFPNARQSIIDTMMNLQLFWWHQERIGTQPEWYEVAVAHAEKTRELFIRADGSVWQDVSFSRFSGTPLATGNRQGFDNTENSTWSRGQAWAMFGFTDAWLATGDEDFLDVAVDTTEYYLANQPADRVPWFDYNPAIFDDPNAHLKDSSAAAIAADALLNLSEVHPDLETSQRYFNEADAIVQSLTKNYLGPFSLQDDTTVPGQLIHGCWFWQEQPKRDSELIWGSYYLLDALRRLLNEPEVFSIGFQTPAENGALQIDAIAKANRLKFAGITADLTELGLGDTVEPDSFDPETGEAIWIVSELPGGLSNPEVTVTLTDGFGREASNSITLDIETSVKDWQKY